MPSCGPVARPISPAHSLPPTLSPAICVAAGARVAIVRLRPRPRLCLEITRGMLQETTSPSPEAPPSVLARAANAQLPPDRVPAFRLLISRALHDPILPR